MVKIKTKLKSISRYIQAGICPPHSNVFSVASLAHAFTECTREITRRTKVFKELQEQKEFIETILNTSSAIIVGLDKNRRIKIFNRGAEKITGYRWNEVACRDWFEIFFKPDIYDEMDNVWKRAWGGEFNSYVNPIQTKQGDERIISWQTSGMYDSEDEMKHMLISIGEDITEHILAENARKINEKKYKTIINSMEGAAYICSHDYCIEYMNRAMIEKTGHDALGEICYTAIYNRNKKCPWCVFDKIRQQKKSDYEVEDPNNSHWYFVENSPIFNTDGTISKLTVFCDITHQKLNQLALKKSAEQLRSLALRQLQIEEAEKRKLALNLHNSVGQNLTALNINLTIIQNLLSPESYEKISGRLSDCMDLTSKIFQQIRDVMIDLRPEALDDFGLVAALCTYCKKFETRYNIRTQIKGSEFVPRLESKMETALFRIIQEAMTNAAKHSEADVITMTFESNDKFDRMTFADNGKGFDPEKLNLPGKGNGWGLTSMQERAVAIGMDFIMTSSKNSGTKIIVERKRPEDLHQG